MKHLTDFPFFLLAALTFTASTAQADTSGQLVMIGGTMVRYTGGAHTITLLGKPFDDRRLFMTELYLAVDGGDMIRLPEEAGSGYEPHIIPADFTGDGIDELLITAATGGSGGIVNGIVCQIGVNGGVSILFDTGKEMAAPVTGRFLDGYRASVSILDTTVVLDLSARREYYKGSDAFSAGKPTGQMQPWSDPYGLLLPDDPDGDGVCGLACWQSVSSVAHVDRIALIKTVLSWTGTGWGVTGIEITAQDDVRIE